MSEWFEADFPLRADRLIRVEDRFTDNQYVLRAELPGIDPDKDVQVTVANGLLTLHAERQEEKKTANRSEFRYGAFHRAVRLPANADEKGITAGYDSGILTVTVPLTAPEPSGRTIPIGTAPDSTAE